MARMKLVKRLAGATLFCVAARALLGCSGGEGMRAGGNTDLFTLLPPPAPEIDLKKVAKEPPPPPWAPKDPSMSYVLANDFGIRADEGGKGSFLSPRSHGRHNGIDFLAPVGAPVLAACNGKAKSDRRGGYGNVVQLVCKLPDNLGGSEGLYASFFYAHLSKSNVGSSQWVHVKAGTKLGAVGKTGNASGPKIKPHLHLEVIVRESEESALEEHHSGVDAKAKESADRFFELLEEECLEPAKFKAEGADIRRERRADPFVLLTCAAKPRPELSEPDDSELKRAQIKWSAHYSARGFDVDRGPR